MIANEFKFGDLVDYFGKPFLFLKCIHDGDCLIADELEVDTVAVEELTLISRHQEWVSLSSKYPEPMGHVNLSVHKKDEKNKYVIKAMWIPPKHISADDFCWDGFDLPEDENGECWTPSGWYEESNEANDYLSCLIGQDITPTHWMPLPEPPKELP